MKPVLYLVRDLPAPFASWVGDRVDLRGGGPRPPAREEWIRRAAGAQVLVVSYLDPVDEPLLQALPTVRHVASYGVGVNHIDLEACRRHRVLVTNTPGGLTAATADRAFGLLLAAARRVAEGDRLIRAGRRRGARPRRPPRRRTGRAGRGPGTGRASRALPFLRLGGPGLRAVAGPVGRDTVFLAEPLAQIDDPAAIGAEGMGAIGRPATGRPATGRAGSGARHLRPSDSWRAPRPGGGAAPPPGSAGVWLPRRRGVPSPRRR